MKSLFILLALGITAGFPLRADDGARFKMITKLEAMEPYGAQAFHAGVLWVGRSRSDGESQRMVEAYLADGTLVGRIPLSHGAQYIHRYTANSVMVTGVTPYPTHAMNTIISYEGGKLRNKGTKTWGLEVTPLHYARLRDGKEYFGAPGGSLNQPPLEPGQPAPPGVESIMVSNGSGYRFLKPQLKFLQTIVAQGSFLFALEGGSLEGNDNIARVDPKTETATRAFKFGQYLGMGFPISISSHQIAIPVRETNEVLILNSDTMKLERSIPVAAGTPRAISVFGSCIAAASQESKKVTVLRISDGTEIETLDFGAKAGNSLYGLKAIDVDTASKSVFVRSGFPGAIMTPEGDRNSVWAATQVGAFSRCLVD